MINNIQSNNGENQQDQRKHKLTLGLNKEVIEKAKAAGINISKLTENLLIAATYQHSNRATTKADVSKAYADFFQSTFDIIYEYTPHYTIEIGKHTIPRPDGKAIEAPIFYNPYGFIFYGDNIREEPPNLEDVLDSLYEPRKILNNLMLVVLDAIKENREKIEKIRLVSRFVKVLVEQDEKRNKVESKTKTIL